MSTPTTPSVISSSYMPLLQVLSKKEKEFQIYNADIKKGELFFNEDKVSYGFLNSSQLKKIAKIAECIQSLVENDIKTVINEGDVDGDNLNLANIQANLEKTKNKLLDKVKELKPTKSNFEKFTNLFKQESKGIYVGASKNQSLSSDLIKYLEVKQKIKHHFAIAKGKLHEFTTPIAVRAVKERLDRTGKLVSKWWHFLKSSFSYINAIQQELQDVENGLQVSPNDSVLLKQKEDLKAILLGNDQGVESLTDIGRAIIKDLSRSTKMEKDSEVREVITNLTINNTTKDVNKKACAFIEQTITTGIDAITANNLTNLAWIIRLIAEKTPEEQIISFEGDTRRQNNKKNHALLTGNKTSKSGPEILYNKSTSWLNKTANIIRTPDKLVGTIFGRLARFGLIGIMETGNVLEAFGFSASVISTMVGALPYGASYVPPIMKYGFYAYLVEPALLDVVKQCSLSPLMQNNQSQNEDNNNDN